jgi:hypothetical protein
LLQQLVHMRMSNCSALVAVQSDRGLVIGLHCNKE